MGEKEVNISTRGLTNVKKLRIVNMIVRGLFQNCSHLEQILLVQLILRWKHLSFKRKIPDQQFLWMKVVFRSWFQLHLNHVIGNYIVCTTPPLASRGVANAHRIEQLGVKICYILSLWASLLCVFIECLSKYESILNADHHLQVIRR
jgi:hypothetical protein